MVYDLGSAGGSAADHLIIGRADLLQADNVTAVRLRHSADNVSYTTAFDNTTFDTETLVGTKSQDYIETFTETASRRYWELRLTAGSASKFTCSKIQFGKFFEFAYDVYRYTSSYVQKSKPFMAADGSLYYTKTQEDAYQYQLEYKGVTDTEANNFESYLFEPDKYGGFVYTAGETNLLDEHTLLHYKVASYRLTKTWNEWNDLAITLEEQL